jgi:VWFA-related protein
MGDKLRKSREAVAAFLKTANARDEFFLVQFNDQPELVVPFTPQPEEIQDGLALAECKGETALLDAVYLAIHEMKKGRKGRKAILIISDGGENASRYSRSEVKKLVKEADVQIYSMGMFASIGLRPPGEISGPRLLSEISEQTGGRHIAVNSSAELPDVAAKIGLELRNQYVLGYYSTNQNRDGKYRRVQVRLLQRTGLPPLKATFRQGYYAPSE